MAIGVLDIKFVSRFVEMTGTSAMLAVMIGLAVGIDFALFIPTRRRSEEKGELQKEPPGGVATEPDDHGLGRSRGGLTTKLHLAVEQGQKPMSIVITAGQRGDSPQFEVVPGRIRVPRPGPGRPRTLPKRVRTDKAYASRKNRAYLRRRGIRCTIPDKTDQVRNPLVQGLGFRSIHRHDGGHCPS
ncbi:transposase [Streptomyces mirabilis]|uniref:transposase n=1 Tax=Streptomyces mirabilis TaxID=68239 RepID=UPI003F4D325A